MSKDGARRGALHISTSELGHPVVELDGVNVADSLTSLTLRLEADCLPTAVLDIMLLDVSTMSEDPAYLIPAATRDLLVALGWTPPEGDGAS